MSYPRTASPHRQFNSQPTGQSSQLPARSRTNMAPYPTRSNSQHKLSPNLQLGRHPNQQPVARIPVARQPVSQANIKQAQNAALQNPEATFIAWYRRLFVKRAAWIGVGIIALSLLAVVPFRAGSESIDLSSCEKKIKPTGAISRGQMTALLALPAGAKQEAVRQVVDEPYCTLPAIAQSTPDEKTGTQAIPGAQREAYPLAFDPEAWVVLAYSQTGEYVGYDFVFKY